ncbi:hypothetical protein [Delftia sp. HK171]|uniref:hypothetical protein n=1 Tax=Delftia sp. HK171 TaxID=1920191 RepID=UPI001C8A54A6|nr:hypothetical protein [Delftia sp. HK171]
MPDAEKYLYLNFHGLDKRALTRICSKGRADRELEPNTDRCPLGCLAGGNREGQKDKKEQR